jgi:hypothetical protein
MDGEDEDDDDAEDEEETGTGIVAGVCSAAAAGDA